MELIIIMIIFILLYLYYRKEQIKNDINIGKIKLRINVNGIRGKSTITRMTTAVLAGAGYNVMGKTTGTAPRIIINDSKKEIEIERKPRGVNINEQIEVIDYCAKEGYDALVCECMAVNPEYQKIYQEKMLKGNIGVIVNVLEDHLDLMGPGLDEIALAFKATIPYNGKLVISDSEYNDYFISIAKKRGTDVFIARDSDVPEGYLEKFDYVLFPNNVSIPLAISRALGIDKELALKSMLKANMDPGALIIKEIENYYIDTVFVNAFAANDPSSTLSIWSQVEEQALLQKEKPLIIFNGRKDRVDRTIQFAKDCLPKINVDYDLVLMGESVDSIRKCRENSKIPNIDNMIDLEYIDGEEVFNKIFPIMGDRIVFCIGNIHGEAEKLLEKISALECGEDINMQNLDIVNRGGDI